MIKSLTFLDVSPYDLEFKTPYVLKNWTPSRYEEFKSEQIAEKRRTVQHYNGIGVPWGLMPIYIEKRTGTYLELQNEARWYSLTEKTWKSKSHFLKLLPDKENIFETKSIDQTIPINIIMTTKSDDQICLDKKLSRDSADCAYEIDANNYSIAQRLKLKDLSQNGQVVNCTLDQCSSDYFVTNGAEFTVSNLILIL